MRLFGVVGMGCSPVAAASLAVWHAAESAAARLLWELRNLIIRQPTNTEQIKFINIGHISELRCLGWHESAFLSSVVVCLNCPGICAVTFFSHSLLLLLLLTLPPLDFPKVLCFMCAFLWNRGAGRVGRSRDDCWRRGRMKWGGCLFAPPKPHTFLEWLWSEA